MSEHVVWFDNTETGAPALNNSPASLIGVIRACASTGFNVKTLTSIVVSGGVATATCAGHGYSGVYGKDLLISGATPAGLNGRKALTFVDTNTFKFAAPGVADGAATGTITAKRDPLGWVELFSDTGKSIFKRSDVTATSMLLYILDTNTAPASATEARVRMIEGATDINTLSGLAPTDGQLSGGQYWNKGSDNATAKQWTLVGDGKRFYLVTQADATVFPTAGDTGYASAVMCFGDIIPLNSADAYHCLLAGQTSLGYGGGSGAPDNHIGGASTVGVTGSASMVLSRPYSQLGAAAVVAYSAGDGYKSGASNHQLLYPSPVDNGFVMRPGAMVVESAPGGFAIRGFMPGVLHFHGRSPSLHQQIFEPVVNFPGRKVLGLATYAAGDARIGFDITGPWG